ncbi:hypothetical protein [Polaromonas sp.]|uniref:hypothetical protein n=1 Tax=Polaromonas sp. TaxID=1869339 RepID=UPI003CBD2431
MPHLPYSIELHDSKLEAIVSADGAAILKLRPAYVHRNGKGWVQSADIRVGTAQVDLGGAALPANLADGRITNEGGPYHNLLDLPLKISGPVVVTLELFSDEVIRVAGIHAEVVLYGEPEFVEDVA